jgi:ankyrin repeat protein
VKDDDHEADALHASTLSSKRALKEMARKLWLAVEVGDKLATLKILQQCVNKQYVSINCSNSDGWTPLHLAASEGHAGLVEILIEYGAIIDARAKTFRTPLHIACIRGNFAVI